MVSTDYCGTMLHVCDLVTCCAPSNDNVVDCGIAGCSSVGAITLEQISEDAPASVYEADAEILNIINDDDFS
jgi:hypothetical protein